MAASSSFSSLAHVKRFHVFPSFHGPDVRRGFLSHLHNLFASKGITMFNDQEIERGHTIGSELIQAIRESRVSIVLLSKNYASSSWCLDELVEILKCRKDQGQIVMPIFYDVDPSDVRKQKGDFGIAFEKTCEGETEEKKRRWIEALADVATIAGEHSCNWTDEAAMIKKFATDVLNKVNVEALKEAFRSFDVDQNGFISAPELRYVLTIHGQKVTDEQVEEIIRKADVDGDGRISYNEFVKLMADGDGRIGYDEFVKLMAAKITDEEAAMVEKSATSVYATDVTLSWAEKKDMMEVFMAIDVDQNSFITAAEYQYWLKNKGHKITDEEIEEVIRKADVDGDGRMNFDEFVKLLNKTTDEDAAMVEKSATSVYVTDVTLSWEEKKAKMNVFMAIDVDQNGFITAAEYQYWLKNKGHKITDEEIEDVIRKADVDGDGRMNFDEFVKLLNKTTDEDDAMVEKSATSVYATDVTLSWEEKKGMMEVFMAIDVDQNGFITAGEYQYWLKNREKKVTDKEARNIIRKADFDGDGRLNFDEFVKLLKGEIVKDASCVIQ